MVTNISTLPLLFNTIMVIKFLPFTIHFYISILLYRFFSAPMVSPVILIPSSFISSINSRRMTSYLASTQLAVRSRLPVANSCLRQALIRSPFITLQKGSRLPVLFRKQVLLPPSPPIPILSPSSPTSLLPRPKLSDKLVKRRQAREARPRRWVQSPRSSATSSERQSSVSPSSLQAKKTPPDVTAARDEPIITGKKYVSFGEVSVIRHPGWINMSEHVFDLPPQEPVQRRAMPPRLSAHDAL